MNRANVLRLFPIRDRYPPYSETKLRRLIFLLEKRPLPSMRFIPYVASFALGIASVFLLRYIAKVIETFSVFAT